MVDTLVLHSSSYIYLKYDIGIHYQFQDIADLNMISRKFGGDLCWADWRFTLYTTSKFPTHVYMYDDTVPYRQIRYYYFGGLGANRQILDRQYFRLYSGIGHNIEVWPKCFLWSIGC